MSYSIIYLRSHLCLFSPVPAIFFTIISIQLCISYDVFSLRFSIFHLSKKFDLVGFREENVLQVSGFYKADVQVNYLAELMSDKSMAVKEQVVQMLREFMTEMGDRYDHQTR